MGAFCCFFRGVTVVVLVVLFVLVVITLLAVFFFVVDLDAVLGTLLKVGVVCLLFSGSGRFVRTPVVVVVTVMTVEGFDVDAGVAIVRTAFGLYHFLNVTSK